MRPLHPGSTHAHRDSLWFSEAVLQNCGGLDPRRQSCPSPRLQIHHRYGPTATSNLATTPSSHVSICHHDRDSSRASSFGLPHVGSRAEDVSWRDPRANPPRQRASEYGKSRHGDSWSGAGQDGSEGGGGDRAGRRRVRMIPGSAMNSEAS